MLPSKPVNGSTPVPHTRPAVAQPVLTRPLPGPNPAKKVSYADALAPQRALVGIPLDFAAQYISKKNPPNALPQMACGRQHVPDLSEQWQAYQTFKPWKDFSAFFKAETDNTVKASIKKAKVVYFVHRIDGPPVVVVNGMSVTNAVRNAALVMRQVKDIPVHMEHMEAGPEQPQMSSRFRWHADMSDTDLDWILAYTAKSLSTVRVTRTAGKNRMGESIFCSSVDDWNQLLTAYDQYIKDNKLQPTLSYYRESVFMSNEYQELQGTIAPKYIEGVRYEARMTATRHLASFICSLGATVMLVNSLMRITAQSAEILDQIERMVPEYLANCTYTQGTTRIKQPLMFYTFRRDVPATPRPTGPSNAMTLPDVPTDAKRGRISCPSGADRGTLEEIAEILQVQIVEPAHLHARNSLIEAVHIDAPVAMTNKKMVWDGIDYFISFPNKSSEDEPSSSSSSSDEPQHNQHAAQTPSTRMVARAAHDAETPLSRADKRTRTLTPPRIEDDMASAKSISDRETDEDGAGTW